MPTAALCLVTTHLYYDITYDQPLPALPARASSGPVFSRSVDDFSVLVY